LKDKILKAEDAVSLIKDGAHVAIHGSGGGVCEPTLLLRSLGEYYRQTGSPKGITIVHSTGIGDREGGGLDHLALPGLVKRDIAGHFGMSPKMGELILAGEVEAYNFPQGVLSHMFHAVAAKTPGVITKIGLNTYVDPRLEGGKANDITTEDLVQVIELNGEEWLFWPRFNFDVAFVRGTTADLNGNITNEEDGPMLEATAIAQAVKNSGGIVIAQVKYLAQTGSLNPQHVRIPGIYVDHIVVDPEQKQTCLHSYEPAFAGHVKAPLERMEPLPLGPKKVIARRAAKELFEGAVVNLGYGAPDGVAAVAAEEKIMDQFTLTVEQGSIGGRPAGGVVFGMAYNPEAIIPMDAQFTFYDGGGIDLAFLGTAQIDRFGNVNSSRVGRMLAGCGGFINITQNAKKVVFCGTFTAKGLRCTVGDGRLTIDQEGQVRKFVQDAAQITFSAEYSMKNEQPVLYVTERAVFSRSSKGLMLEEIAPGIDLERDILAHMDFRPEISPDLKEMDPAFFRE
jgi:propionate CoA-transferase